MPAKLAREGDVLRLSLSGLDRAAFGDALQRVKAVPGRRWNAEDKIWEFPAEPRTAERLLHAIKPVPTSDVLAWVRQARLALHEELATSLPADAELRVPWANKLYPFQRAGVEFLTAHPHALVGDDMGLGKSVQAITTIVEHAWPQPPDPAPPVLVVAPNSVKGNWAREIGHWADIDARVLDGRTADKRRHQLERWTREGRWIIVNWEKLRAKRAGRKVVMAEPLLASTEWYGVIADECHRAKNRKSQQTLGLWQIHAPVQLALTGTPILSSPDELWAILAWLRPEQYGRGGNRIPYWTFYDQYVDYYESTYGRVITGVRNPDELRFELKDKLVRRTKGTVLDLPPKTRQYIETPLLPKQRKLYEEAERVLWLELEQEAQAGDDRAGEVLAGRRTLLELPNGAARCTRLRQIASTPALLGAGDVSAKLDTAVELIEDAGRPIVVFAQFKGTCERLRERLAKRKIACETITGDVTPEVRTERVARFQDGDIQVMACTLAAGGVGITLTAADTAIFIERDWVPAINEQAEDRLHRIGQERNVTAIILQAPDTVDTDRVAPANQLKSIIVGSVLQQDAVPERSAA